MLDRDHVQSLLKEAGVYQKQGLLDESKEKYQEILNIVEASEDLSEDADLIDLVRDRIRAVEDTLDEIGSEPDTVELPEEVQDLIGNLFSFSENEDTASVESAVALAKFGQYEKALSKFQELLDRDILPMAVAQNMLQCHLSAAKHEAAISQFEDWISDKTFAAKELAYLRDFLKNILERDGMEADLPQVDHVASAGETTGKISENITEEDISGVLSVKLIFDDRRMKDQIRDFDVLFQLGNSVTFNVKNNEQDLLVALEPGAKVSKIQCYASFYFFNARGVISEKKMVTAGPKEGDYSVTLTLDNR